MLNVKGGEFSIDDHWVRNASLRKFIKSASYIFIGLSAGYTFVDLICTYVKTEHIIEPLYKYLISIAACCAITYACVSFSKNKGEACDPRMVKKDFVSVALALGSICWSIYNIYAQDQMNESSIPSYASITISSVALLSQIIMLAFQLKQEHDLSSPTFNPQKSMPS